MNSRLAAGLWATFWVLWAAVGLLLLTGCGGSMSDDEPEQTRPPVNCQSNPKACI